MGDQIEATAIHQARQSREVGEMVRFCLCHEEREQEKEEGEREVEGSDRRRGKEERERKEGGRGKGQALWHSRLWDAHTPYLVLV